jgi:hypothetical protein
MGEYRLKIKIGAHEFEAEGPADAVAKQFKDFKELIASLPETSAPAIPNGIPPASVAVNSLPAPVSALDKIFKAEGRVVSLTALPATVADAALLLLLGQREYRKNEASTSSEISDGLSQSGYTPGRIDRIMEDFVGDGWVIKTGVRRGTRYRLTNQGLLKAQKLAGEVLSTVP